jgi:hypothetical protein
MAVLTTASDIAVVENSHFQIVGLPAKEIP